MSAPLFGGLVCAFFTFMTSAPTPKIVQPQGFDVVGIQVRANNRKEISAKGSIAAQWERFIKEDIAKWGAVAKRAGITAN